MSTTIDSLDIQISTSAGQSAQKIQEIANALGDLKNQGKIGAATSAMKSLAKALDVLNPALNAMNPAKLQQLRAAMSSLSNIQKASGLSSTIKELKKIPEVMNSLDESALTKMELQMRRLSNAIAPLAKEIEKIGDGFSKLPKRVTQVVNATNKMAKASGSAAVAVKKQTAAINSGSLNVMTAIQNFESMAHVATLVKNSIQAVIGEALEWDGIQYRFGRAFGEDAEEVYTHIQKINEVMGINIQQFMQYSSLYGSLLSGFGMAQDKVTTISVGLTELSYDIWAAYNDRFKTLEQASEAVRSAITGEIEPIRNAGIALTENSLQEYLDQVGMAHISIEKLSEAQKAEVRYAAMMNAAMQQGIVGTYAKEMKTAEGAVRDLSQSFKGLVQALGSLFIPIIQAAIPYVTAFINLLYDAVQAIAELFNITLFEIDWGNVPKFDEGKENSNEIEKNFGGAAAAAKKIKDYTMGFDELNIIQPQTENGGGGGSGSGVDWGAGLDLKTMWDDSIFAEASRQVDELKQKILNWFEEWKTEIAIVAGALGLLAVTSLLESLGSAIGLSDDLLLKLGGLKKIAGTAIILTLQYSLQSEFLENFIEEGSWEDYVWFAVVGALGAFGSYLTLGKTGLILSLGVTAMVSLKAALEDGSIDSTEEVVSGLTGLATAAGAVALAWSKLKNTDFGAFFALLKEGNSVFSVLGATFPKLTSFFTSIGPTIAGAAKSVGAFVGGLSSGPVLLIAGIIAAIVSVVSFLKNNWEAVTQAVKDFFATNIAPKLEEIKGHWEKIKENLGPVGDLFVWLYEGIKDIIKGFKDWWEAAKPIEVLGEIFETVGGIIFSVVSGVIAGAINTVVGVIESAVQYFSGIVGIIRGVIDLIVAVFTKGDIRAAWNKIWDGVVDVVSGLYGLTIKPIKDFVNGIINWFVELWDELVGHSIVPDTINAIVEWFKSLPGKIFKSVQDFVNGIISRFKNMWTSIVTWYKKSVAPKFTSAYWKGVFNNVVSGAASKLGEIKGKISEVWKGVRDWFKTNVTPKLTLSYWKEKFNNIVSGIKNKWTEARKWWNSNKPSLNTVQASIASVKEKLSSAWSTARNWWNNSKAKLSNVSITVNSIKDKLSSAWNTAKEWFNKQSLKMNIKMPHFEVGWNYNISSWQATIADFLFDKKAMPYLDVSWYAKGGMPSMGEMFVAREAGPELVGKIGSRNAVVNNDQIVNAVSEGVYAAVVAAMKSTNGNGGNQAVNVYLDGKQITATVEQRQRERGATVMGRQVFSY